ncbi:MAG: endonuclease MutS2 [Streptococcaceae bacterium]|jgi:DNA mismatch repair protein MutS2|nr:endonuclease MutS2 [Streptococcaceae bacterium]
MKKIAQVLEFEKVKALFAPYLTTTQGEEALSNLTDLKELAKMQEAFATLRDFVAVQSENGELRLSATVDVADSLMRLELEAVLSGVEFAGLKKLQAALIQAITYFKEAENVAMPALSNLTDKFSVDVAFEKTLDMFDASGVLLDTASESLNRLRRGIHKDEAEVRGIMQDLLSKHASDLTEQIITIRNERQVLPVKAEAKNKIAGVVQDISSSGATYYIEPRAAASLNVRLQQERLEEKNEIARLLRQLSEQLRPLVPQIRQNAWLLGQIDLIRAKASFMAREKASIPELNEAGNLQLFGARHPLIPFQTAVANTISFDETLQTIVITGPNTGGKTITLKTVGILTLMAQAGLPITAQNGSQVTVFETLYADIGDEQSIEANLSTFSGHMTTIVEILSQATEKSLVLLDELGAGTDPKEGAALAISILETLRKRGVKTLATTHYPELKAYGVETEGVTNASVEFDLETMSPSYRLHMGIPGKSNAFEISRRLGLRDEVIAYADSLLTDDEHDVNTLIARLEEEAISLSERLDEAQSHAQEAKRKEAELDNKLRVLERERTQIIETARQEASEVADKAHEEARQILKQLNDKSTLKPHEVIEAMATLDSLAPGPDLSKNKVLKKAKSQRGLSAGAEVMVESFGQRGKLVRLEKDGRWTVAIGNITAKLAESDFEVLATAKAAPKSKAIKRSVNSSIKAQLDLRGTRYEEAALELDSYIDQALLANLSQITIVHGIGTGVIRDLVQTKLAKNKHIKHFDYAPMNAGGSGATIAQLK